MKKLSKNITVAAILSAETPDTTGEILDIRNADISTLQTGKAPLNTEHTNPDDIAKEGDKDFKGFNTIVGRVVTAKKIFSEDDCDNQYETKAWNDLQVPLIFGYLEFWDSPDAHDNAKAAASLVRMAHQGNFEHMIGFSVEGQILKREGNRLSETVIKRIAATGKPANKAARIEGVVHDSASSGDNVSKTAQDDTDILRKTINTKQWQVVQDFGLSNALFSLRKALEAGTPSAAPSALVGGAALQSESHLTRLGKLMSKKPIRRDSLKKLLPKATDEQLEKVEAYLKKLRLKKYEEVAQIAFEQLIK